MKAAAKDLQTAAASKDAKKIQAAFDKVDHGCVACHEKMK
jgi:cytochrome c556